jgi:hypothetical protein
MYEFTNISEVSVASIISLMITSIIRAMIALMFEAVQTSETLVNSYQSTWRYIPEDSHLQSL